MSDIGIAFSGLTADARSLVDYARIQAQVTGEWVRDGVGDGEDLCLITMLCGVIVG